jgi:glycosyltransferase involved in cell wall biosynthesis
MRISLIIPVYNERQNVLVLYREIDSALRSEALEYEILFVDDGSTDGTTEHLAALAGRDHRVRVVKLRRNFGQTAAMQAGFDLAGGEVLVTLDGDLQNDPADIPLLLAKIDEGYDLVHGWRKARQDPWLTRRLPSRLANWLIRKVTRVPVRDLGCTLKAIRREIATELQLCGEMHRFIPILAHWRGARCAEVVTHHRPRRYGTSKYGLSRAVRVILDLITVKFLLDYVASPMKLFGKFGLLCLTACASSLAATIWLKLAHQIDMTGNPLLLLSVLALLAGIQMFSLGLLGELVVRIYFDRQHKKPYAIGELLGFPGASQRRVRRTA